MLELLTVVLIRLSRLHSAAPEGAPDPLPTQDVMIDDGAGAAVTMRWILIWFLVALVTAVPALILLYVLEQRGEIAAETAEPGPAGDVRATAGEPGRQ